MFVAEIFAFMWDFNIYAINFVSSKRVVDVLLVECDGGQMIQHMCLTISISALVFFILQYQVNFTSCA